MSSDWLLFRKAWPAFFMKLRRESAENGDFSGPKGEFKKAPLSPLAVAGFMKWVFVESSG
jgi:hypothetical protein